MRENCEKRTNRFIDYMVHTPYAVVTTDRKCIVHLSTADSVENFYVARKIFQTRTEQAEHAGGYSTCRINCVWILRLAACPDGRTWHVRGTCLHCKEVQVNRAMPAGFGVEIKRLKFFGKKQFNQLFLRKGL